MWNIAVNVSIKIFSYNYCIVTLNVSQSLLNMLVNLRLQWIREIVLIWSFSKQLWYPIHIPCQFLITKLMVENPQSPSSGIPNSSCSSIFFFKILFIYLTENEREREHKQCLWTGCSQYVVGVKSAWREATPKDWISKTRGDRSFLCWDVCLATGPAHLPECRRTKRIWMMIDWEKGTRTAGR